MKPCHLLLCGCLLLAACSSGEEKSTGKSEPTTLNYLQQDKTINPANQAGGFTVSLNPDPLIAAQPAAAMITGCQKTVEYTWSVNGVRIAEATGPQFSRDHFKRDDDVGLQVSCGGNLEETSATVMNSPPVVRAVKFASQNLVAGTDLQVIPEAEDVDGDPIEFVYQWSVNGEYLPSVTGPVLPGEYVVRNNQIGLDVIPADPFSDGPTFEGINFSVPNSPPKITSQPPQTYSSQAYEYQVIASDPDNDPLTYRLEQAPDGMKISANGLLSWRFEKAPSGEFTIAIIVEDPDGLQFRQAYTLNLSPPE